ncbi:MAG: hypothetical protein QXU18_14050 [Thermoplasmatales archaeon]
MRPLFYDIPRTVNKAIERFDFLIARILQMLGISRSWYYTQLSLGAILDGRFNPYAIDNEDEKRGLCLPVTKLRL